MECKDLNAKFKEDEGKTEKRETNIFDDKKGMYALFDEGRYHILP